MSFRPVLAALQALRAARGPGCFSVWVALRRPEEWAALGTGTGLGAEAAGLAALRDRSGSSVQGVSPRSGDDRAAAAVERLAGGDGPPGADVLGHASDANAVFTGRPSPPPSVSDVFAERLLCAVGMDGVKERASVSIFLEVALGRLCPRALL